ncbi:MAG: XamI family restriction endonuclease [Rhodobacteraceae bacterium]|nr:XamI family restriction endonuclease [Paracoccaceae bacterium]
MPSTPKLWSREELEVEAQTSINAFVDRRLAEPRERYLVHFKQRRQALIRLARALQGVTLETLNAQTARVILNDPDMFDALRYVAGPPISADDLAVMVNRSIAKLLKSHLQQDDELVRDILFLIHDLADPARFPWIAASRPARLQEVKTALTATAALHASQSLQTERRGYGRKVETRLADALEERGFNKVKTPNKSRITSPSHWPSPQTFYGECTVYGRKADLFIGLTDGRCVAVEAKDSSSALNSVKRVLNDTAAKAEHWRRETGTQVLAVALLSGVFKVESLLSAQDSGLYLVWTHDLGQFVDWLKVQ